MEVFTREINPSVASLADNIVLYRVFAVRTNSPALRVLNEATSDNSNNLYLHSIAVSDLQELE